MRRGVVISSNAFFGTGGGGGEVIASVSPNGSLKGNRTTNLPSGDFSILFAFDINTKTNNPHALFTLTLSAQQAIETYGGCFDNYPIDSEFRAYFDATSSDNKLAQAAVLGWYWVAIVRSGTAITYYYKTDSATSWSSLSAGSHSAAITRLDMFTWNDGSLDQGSSSEFLRKLCVWSEVKSTTTLMQETKQRSLYSSTNINGFYPLTDQSVAGNDSSGNGYDFTMSGTGVTSSTNSPSFPDG